MLLLVLFAIVSAEPCAAEKRVLEIERERLAAYRSSQLSVDNAERKHRECLALAARNELARIEMQQAASAQAAEDARAATLAMAEAKKRGLTVDMETGLTETIAQLRRGEITLATLSKRAIRIDGLDNAFEVFQVASANDVLLRDEGVVLWLKGYKKRGGKNTWIDGARLVEASEFGFYVVRGVQNYRTAFGPKQAIVIEPAF